MYNDKKILAIIPARGGSKRLKNKNILELNAKPLIAWSIDEAKKSKYIDTVLVSTDSKDIYEVAKKHGAYLPFMRPKSLAKDNTKSIDVITHAIKYLQDMNELYDEIIILQPTSPLRDIKDIDGAIEHFFEKNATSVVSVCETEHSPLWSNTLNDDFSMVGFLDTKYNNSRSQDLPTYYRLNGAFYMSNIDALMKTNTFFIDKNFYAYVMTQEHSVDIDTKLDFLIAKTMMQEGK